VTRLLIVLPFAALLGGCGTPPATVTAGHDIQAASAGHKYKVCPVLDMELEREPYGYIGPLLLGGNLTKEAQQARAAREAAERDVSSPCPARQGPWPPQASRSSQSASVKETPPLGGTMPVPNFGDGQTVYSPNECIGAVVNGQCHGSILPDYSRFHPTCYGQMLNGMCTGPMF
jgi:hypothetical protein